MSSRKEARLNETVSKLVVLAALTESVQRSPTTANMDAGRLSDSAGRIWKADDNGVATDEELHDSESWDEYDDWRDIRACGDDSTLPADPYDHFYDSKTSTMYYIDRECHQNANAKVTLSQGALTSVDDPSTQGRTPNSPDSGEIVSRLKLMDGQYGPCGYRTWLSMKIQNQRNIESGILGFASLCATCHRMFTHSLVMFSKVIDNRMAEGNRSVYRPYHRVEVFAHHGTIQALRASVRAGCHICSLLLGPNIRKQNGHDSSTYFLEWAVDGFFYRSEHPTWNPYIWLSLEQEQTEDTPSLRCTTTDAPEVRTLAQIWLFRCLKEDEKTCSVEGRFLPSRLVQIVTENGTLKSANLVLAGELPPDTRYLTLSHCWGDTAKPVTLTRETLDEFRNVIPLPILSKTFHETFQVVILLGFRHVWIDSLCILQDSEEDWSHEAAHMGDIYRHSTCTIAASGARDGNDGLFFERTPLSLVDCPLFERRAFQMVARKSEYWHTPLSERAWAVQERYLSPRMLEFGPDMIQWSCRRTLACEGPSAHSVAKRNYSFPNLLGEDLDEYQVDFVWRRMVQLYSGSELTFWKDKWPAFQGLAAEFEKTQGWSIVHGLRSHLLGRDLLWRARDPQSGCMTIECGEPSWSWLNLEGGIYLLIGPDMHSDARIILQKHHVPGPATIIGQHPLQIEACMTEFQSGLRGLERFKCTLTAKSSNHFIDVTSEKDRLLHGSWNPDTVPVQHGNLWALQTHSQWERINSSETKGFEQWNHKMAGLVITAVSDSPGFWRRMGTYNLYTTYDQAKQASDSDGIDEDEGRDDWVPEILSGDEAFFRGFPCPWNREKTTVILI